MGEILSIPAVEWQALLNQLAHIFPVYAPVASNGIQDYELIDERNSGSVVYNHPIPVTPLKTFFLPVKENVSGDIEVKPWSLIMGVPACDLAALDILDEMYLGRDYPDIFYRARRESAILAGTDCHSLRENCHCMTYGINPWPGKNSDLGIVRLDDMIYLEPASLKGEELLAVMGKTAMMTASENDRIRIREKRERIAEVLAERNRKLPGTAASGRLIEHSGDGIWQKYSSTCVSCGACAAICPTCTCFLLIDRPDFEKIRQLDACQYPGFERVAAGEDPLRELHVRFRNRYLCKYAWKPGTFNSASCTGCGRCIDSCIGKINKNELLEELASEGR